MNLTGVEPVLTLDDDAQKVMIDASFDNFQSIEAYTYTQGTNRLASLESSGDHKFNRTFQYNEAGQATNDNWHTPTATEAQNLNINALGRLNIFPTGRSGMHRIVVGNWRTPESGPTQVVSGPFGREKVHFEAPEAERLAAEMKQFVEWFNTANDLDPVLKAGIAHLWFVTIHPFEDGNGRIARAIGDMALARADGTSDRFYSLSSQIEAERKDYYAQLERQQRGTPDITDWLVWFLECFGRAIANAETMLRAVLFKAKLWERINQNPVNDRQRLIVNRMLEPDFKGHMNTSKYAKLAKCSTDTALRDIQDLKQR